MFPSLDLSLFIIALKKALENVFFSSDSHIFKGYPKPLVVDWLSHQMGGSNYYCLFICTRDSYFCLEPYHDWAYYSHRHPKRFGQADIYICVRATRFCIKNETLILFHKYFLVHKILFFMKRSTNNDHINWTRIKVNNSKFKNVNVIKDSFHSCFLLKCVFNSRHVFVFVFVFFF